MITKSDIDTMRAFEVTPRQQTYNRMVARGVDATLVDLNFPGDRGMIWYNLHTGDEEPLHILLKKSAYLKENEEFPYILEHWTPLIDENPIKKAALTITEPQILSELVLHFSYQYKNWNPYPDPIKNFNYVERSIRLSAEGWTFVHGGYAHVRKNKVVVEWDQFERKLAFSLNEILRKVFAPTEQLSLFL